MRKERKHFTPEEKVAILRRPKDVLAWRQQEIHAERDRKLEAARRQRQSRRQQAT
jgi:hypothetical protein